MKLYLGYSDTMQEIAEVDQRMNAALEVAKPVMRALSPLKLVGSIDEQMGSVPEQILRANNAICTHDDKIRRTLLKVAGLARECCQLCESALKLSGDYSLHNLNRERVIREVKSAEALLRIMQEERYIGVIKII